MPHIIDAPEIVWQESCQESVKTVQPLPSTLQPQRQRAGLFAALRAAVTVLSKRSVHRTPSVPQPFELPIDRVARQHPFLFIKAMSG